jgi:hypothetical protein
MKPLSNGREIYGGQEFQSPRFFVAQDIRIVKLGSMDPVKLGQGEPSTAEGTVEQSFAAAFNNFVGDYFMFLLFGGAVLYYLFKNYKGFADDAASKRLHREAAVSDEDRAAGMAAARLRQQQHITECAGADQDARKEKLHQAQLEREARVTAALDADKRQTLGGSGDKKAPAPRPDSQTTARPVAAKKANPSPAPSREDVPERLPRLPGGDRYQPSQGDNSNGRYKPTGFQRPSKGG